MQHWDKRRPEESEAERAVRCCYCKRHDGFDNSKRYERFLNKILTSSLKDRAATMILLCTLDFLLCSTPNYPGYIYIRQRLLDTEND